MKIWRILVFFLVNVFYIIYFKVIELILKFYKIFDMMFLKYWLDIIFSLVLLLGFFYFFFLNGNRGFSYGGGGIFC